MLSKSNNSFLLFKYFSLFEAVNCVSNIQLQITKMIQNTTPDERFYA